MDKTEVLPMIKEYVKENGYLTSPYGFYITSNMAIDEFIVYKKDNKIPTYAVRLGVVTVHGNSVEFHPTTYDEHFVEQLAKSEEPHSYSLFDPNSLPELIKQLEVHFGVMKAAIAECKKLKPL